MDKNYIFSDLSIDFNEKQVSGNKKNNDIVQGNDLVINYDIEAIKNSIKNILFQKRHLTGFDIDLRKYIGEQMSTGRAISLGDEIDTALRRYEPRIRVEKIFVSMDDSTSTYYITLLITLLNFNTIIQLDSTFDRTGQFAFINK